MDLSSIFSEKQNPKSNYYYYYSIGPTATQASLKLIYDFAGTKSSSSADERPKKICYKKFTDQQVRAYRIYFSDSQM